MYLILIILPFIGSIIAGLFGRYVGIKGSQLITCILVIIATILSIIAFIEVTFNNSKVILEIVSYIDSETLIVKWALNFDSLSTGMLIPVLCISSLVHIYSISYMENDPHQQRFFSYLSMFTFMMMILVTADNYLIMFIGWEMIGVCSYLLVCYWFTRIAANQSAMSAFITNRVGDTFLTLSMIMFICITVSLDYNIIYSLAPYLNEDYILGTGLCILLAAMAKSSQLGLHVWLSLAMEGPTPVSALIHAATMVTAGVYILIRSSPLIEYSSTVLLFCLWIGCLTTVISSLIGLFQSDIKRVIAYSTMSQLGLMVIAIGLSSYSLALFHLVNHAFYKALLFLAAGSIIHAVSDSQDIRKYGGLSKALPLTYSVILIASLSLTAFPYMSGFYSKDFILESAYGRYTYNSQCVYYISVIGALFTTLYSVKVLALTFIVNPMAGSYIKYKKAHEGDNYMTIPLIILAIASIFFGWLSKDLFIGIGSSAYIDNAIYIKPNNELTINTEFAIPLIYKLLPFIMSIIFTILTIIIIEYIPLTIIIFKYNRLGYNIYNFFNLKCLIEYLYNKYITRIILLLGSQTTKVLDKGFIEYIGPYGLEKGLIHISTVLSNLSNVIVTTIALYILLGLVIYTSLPLIFDINIAYMILFIFNLFVLVSTTIV